MKRKLFLSVLFIVLAVHGSWGQIPQIINYQGVLTDANGNLVPDGTYNLTFRLYNVATGGTPLWSETQSISVNKGIFNIILGSVTPLTLPFDEPYRLGVTIGSGPELTPRIQLTSSAYSLNARSVSGGSNIFPSSGNVGIGILRPGEKLEVDGIVKATGFEGTSTITSIKVPADLEITMEPTDNPSIISFLDVFKTGGSPIFSLSETGNLSVIGTVRANGFEGISTITSIKVPADLEITMEPTDNPSIISFLDVFKTGGDPIFSLSEAGNLRIQGSLTEGSSRKLKENIADLSSKEAFETLNGLNPVKFNYKAEGESDLHIGFIAEEVPDLAASSDRKGVSPMDIVAVLTKIVQEQQKRISELEERVRALEVQSK